MIINLTQHMATPEQGALGVVDLPEAYSERADLVRLLTIEELPSAEDLYCRADQLVDLVRESSLDVPIGTAVMIGGAPYLLAHLERALIVAGYRPVYAFSRRESVDSPGADGRVTKTAVFRHAGWVMVASPVSQAASALSKSKAGKPKAAQASRDNGAKGGRPRNNRTPRCHRDGTVSYWSVYRQSFVSRADGISDEELAAMNQDDRERVIAHLQTARKG